MFSFLKSFHGIVYIVKSTICVMNSKIHQIAGKPPDILKRSDKIS